jgi:hypothetical protein
MTTTEATDSSQLPMPKPEPQKEHTWLKQLVGDWTCEGVAIMGPDVPPVNFKTTDHTRSVGDVWFIGEGTGEMPDGTTSTTIATLGYDPAKQRFVGTFLGSMMTNLWVYEGTLDESGRVLTLDTEGPGLSGDGALAKYQDVIEIKSDDERTLTSFLQGEDGQWTQIMSMTYRRVK